MPDKCISDSARDALKAALARLETCPQISQPVIQRTKYGKPILDIEGVPSREFKSMNYLAEHFPGGFYKEGRDLEGRELPKDEATGSPIGQLKATGGMFDVSTDIFEKPLFPDGTPFTHIYTVTKEKRKGLPVYVISNERKNPDYVPPQPTEKPTSKKTKK